MTTLTPDIPTGPIFTSAIPPLHIATTGKYVDISITIESDTTDGTRKEIYSSRLHTISGTIDLDMRSIITTWMDAHATPTAQITIFATGSDDPKSAALILTAIYSRGTISGDAAQFTANRFLTLSQLKLLPLTRAFDSLSAWCEQAESGSIILTLLAAYGIGDTEKINVEFPIQSTPGYNRFDLDFQTIIDDLITTVEPSPVTLTPRSAIVTLGERTFTYRFIPHLPSAAISFANTFNAPEHFWMFGSWSRSGKVTQKKALVGSLYQSAGAEPDPEFTLVTHGLTFTQSYIIPEISMSRAVWVYLFAQGSPLTRQAFKATPVAPGGSALAAATFKAIPTEGSLEASPHGTDMQTHTIKVIAASLPDALGYQFEIPRIFTDQFTHPFI